VILHQSDLKTWMDCALRWRFANVDREPRDQTCALTFGTVVHECVHLLETSGDLPATLDRFRALWADPEALDASLRITRWVKGRSWEGYAQDGITILTRWHAVVQWDPDVVIAREQPFSVPLGCHTLEGRIDKLALRYLAPTDETVVLVADWKSSAQAPTYEDLNEDLQFSAYCYATTRPEFWAGIPDGEHLYANLRDARRMGEWIQLRGPHRKSAGERTARHYNRLAFAVDAIADSVAMGIYVPSLSCATCGRCEFRDRCGLPSPAPNKELSLAWNR
jgi:PD-(D/E)XK nuclease superfamily